MRPRGIVVSAGAALGVALLTFAVVVAIVGQNAEAPTAPPATASNEPRDLPFAAVPLDDGTAWQPREEPSGESKLVIRQFGTELGYVHMGSTTSLCAEVVDAHGAPVAGAMVAFEAHGAATLDPSRAMTNEVGSVCVELTPYEAGTLHLEGTATKEGYQPATAGKVAEVVDGPAARADTIAPAGRPALATTTAIAGALLLAGAVIAKRGGVKKTT